MDTNKFKKFEIKISKLADGVIRKASAELLEKLTNRTKTYYGFYYNESLGIQTPALRMDTLLKLEASYPGIVDQLMDYFINTPIEAIQNSVRKSVFD